MSNLILSKESSEREIKRYFSAVLELSKSDNEFPINLDEVWMLVYSEKSKAVRALKENFIENVDFQPLAQNGERLSNGQFAGGGTTYYLTLPCMEFFIARKVRPVFEVASTPISSRPNNLSYAALTGDMGANSHQNGEGFDRWQ